MILLVICLFLLISLPTGWYIYQKLNQEDTKSIEQFASSSESKTTASESQASSSSSDASATDASSTASASTTPSSSEDTAASSSEAATDDNTTEVVAGEGVNQISARTGVPVETLLKLNGFSSIDEWFAVPGQKVKIK
nr:MULTISPECIES: SAG1386/EF1546 family surface-associated protein [unclassified Enterococcus]